ncbi:putative quinol monooxygenase [Vibrio quintilis]|nr:antibiotic biosynthesis monooxygenase [Vibrio quintilis]
MPAHPDSHHQSTLTPGYYVTAEIRMKDPNRADAAKAALIRLCEQTRKEEAGCTLFELHTCPDDPVKLILWERFNSEADFHLHHQAPHTLAYLAQDFTEIVQIHVSDVLN